jgi:hypothetical protein
MKIAAIGDVHGQRSAIALVNGLIDDYKPDVVTVCGDITNFGPASFALDFLNWIPAKTLAIPGNCDPDDVQEAISRSKAFNLHGTKTRIKSAGIKTGGEYTFVGFGGAPISFLRTLFELDEEFMFNALDAVMERSAILITHAPPFGHVDRIPRGEHVGSHAIEKIVEKYGPSLVLSAHVHEAQGVEKNEKTTFVNVGPAKLGCAAVVEIDDESSAISVKLIK